MEQATIMQTAKNPQAQKKDGIPDGKQPRIRRVVAFVGSPRRRATYEAVQELETSLKSHAPVDFEYVFLADSHLGFCRGCKLCFDKGEEFCPSRDDRDSLLEKMTGADGVIFATPNYSFHVPALMKNLLDRLGFVFHRPRFFGKAFTALVAQGIFGGASIQRYLETMGSKDRDSDGTSEDEC